MVFKSALSESVYNIIIFTEKDPKNVFLFLLSSPDTLLKTPMCTCICDYIHAQIQFFFRIWRGGGGLARYVFF